MEQFLSCGCCVYKATKGKKQGANNRGFNISATAVMAVALAVIVAANYFTNLYANSINAVMTVAVAADTETDTDEWKDLAYRISDEGMVLMENKENTLPLKSDTKVNLLGYYAYNPVYSGSGSGQVSASDSISIVSSLESSGFEINPALEESGIYAPVKEDEAKVKAGEEGVGFMAASLAVNEAGIDSYTGDISFDKLAEYSDTAIVVIGRSGSEGADLTSYEEGDYLELSKNEQDLLESARAGFDKLIVVVDSGNAMQMGWVDEYDVDAVIWSGLPGPYGFEALGQILNGTVNPSGKLPDTWVYDSDSNPANENFGEQTADNSQDRYYVDYVEGIYVGYKWYETAYAEEAVITNTHTQEVFDYKDYESIVAYPFGYGLSYTSFEQEITGGSITDKGSLNAADSYTIDVTVTNTGDVAGKTPVQLYVTVPYTDYDQENGVEKAAVSLVNYEKTEILEPGG